VFKSLIEQLAESTPLSNDQVATAVILLVDEREDAEAKADFLAALARKGETTEEITAFARELRARSIPPPLDAETRSHEILDVCGTGGDRLNTFNISTTVAIIAAAAGVAVAKHGNRAITSQAGSADVLEALGIPIDLTPEQAARSLREHHFAFFFAPKYHPAFKHIGPARKLCAERGQRTIFNFLGPLLNPARPTAQLVGVPRPELCEPIAKVLQTLGTRRGMVVCGQIESISVPREVRINTAIRDKEVRVIGLDDRQLGILPVNEAITLAQSHGVDLVEIAPHAKPPICRLVDFGKFRDAIAKRKQSSNSLPTDGGEVQAYLDELSTLGDNTVAEFYQDCGFNASTMSPNDFALQPATLADLRGSDRFGNAETVKRLLRGEERGPKRDAILLNCAAALFVADQCKSLSDGWELAMELIETGRANAKLKELVRS
jgi:anthranilate phosphoribosyltransferase